jgi:ATP-dependent DNA helicase RecQ
MNCSETIAWDTVLETFKQVWGYSDFRPPQGEIIRCLLAQQDAIVVMPTGGGKSLCFQLPALLQSGLTIVISPLVALMENQVQELRQKRLSAALLHNELSTWERKQVLYALEKQKLRLLYVSPETLLSPSVWERLCEPSLKLNRLVLDEAHCLSQWGDTFRPAYYRLGAVRQALQKHKPPGSRIAIAAFTATADPQTQETIQQVLQLEQPQVFRLNPYRANLRLGVQIAWTPNGRRQRLLRRIQANAGKAGLVYVRTRRDSEELATWLRQKGYQTAAYHAGLSADERRQIEQAWLSDAMRFVVCTNAFGMGVNKPNVRFVIHFHSPSLLSEYVQEVGRAGRDGQLAEAVLFMSEPTGWLDSEDKQRRQFFENQAREQQRSAQQLMHQLPQQGEVAVVSKQFREGAIALSILHRQKKLEWLDPFRYTITQKTSKTFEQSNLQATRQMTNFLLSKDCRWRFLLNSFGFQVEAHNFRCGHCDNCCH